MRIAQIDCFHTDGGYTVFDFVRITTDSGLTGWSEYNESFSGSGVTGAIQALAPHLIGADPRPVAAHAVRMHALRRVPAGGIAHQAIAALENALLDIKAKDLGVPVYALFGGPLRETIRLYWSHCGFFRAGFADRLGVPPVKTLDDLAAAGKEVVDQGYNALKTNLLLFENGTARPNNPGFGQGESFPGRNAERKFTAALRDQLAALRDGAGPDVDLMVDLNFNYTAEGALAMARAAAPFDPTWIEIDMHNADALRRVRDRSPVPIASGEALFGRQQFHPFLTPPAMDVAIIDVPWTGFSESLKVAAMAETLEMNVAPHNFTGPLATLMSAHFAAVVPNLRIMEFDPDHVPWYDDLVTAPPDIRDGHLHLPEGPGWGAEINEDILAAHPPLSA